ncbi:putative fatty acid transporter protein-like [Trypanosoma conorhini]|uniref:Putative fatty acid transporter protein-like n=1 Tax=Trypanosoma conorhini TaxID=83891 RepID=A0A422PQP9_9TRYP|nr:putative fatty acid transporter protein-like [Trypanosoma conorhini]RNF20038.1 putative fatty acid transporter protein-like [Trypanosoma conorhini]
MATVNPEGKWNWVLMSLYAYITTKEYLKLGGSLAAVQARSSMRRAKLFWRDAWQSILPPSPSWKDGRCPRPDDTLDEAIEYLLAPLLSEIAAMAEITHGQSISMTLLRAFRKQSCLVAGAPREHQVVFEMAETDSALPAMRLRGAPLNVTYAEATLLAGLLSEALAWEWYWLTHTPVPVPPETTRSPHSGNSKTRPHALALMLDNCPEFNLIWMAVSEASVWLTFLDVLYDARRPQTKAEAERPVVYHHCSTALLNTNLANHRMLSHSLECAAAEILVMEQKYVPLLFADENDPASGKGERRERQRSPVQLPWCVRRVFLWRAAPPSVPEAAKGVEPWMLAEVRRFNEARCRSAHGDVAALDLFDLVRANCLPQTQQPAFPILAARILSAPPAAHEPTASTRKRQQQQQRRLPVSHIRNTTREALLRFRPVMPVLHIYTSGTTGLPKAARFSHLRFFAAIFLSSVLSHRNKVKEIVRKQQKSQGRSGGGNDGYCSTFKRMFLGARSSLEDELNVLTVYNCLPMYHTVGVVFCMGHLLRALQEQQRAAGAVASYQWDPQCDKSNLGRQQRKLRLAPTARMVIRSKFSASRFTQDLQQYRVTVFQYIGEILRYALHYVRTTEAASHTLDVCPTRNGVAVDGSHGRNNDINGNERETRWVVPFAFGNGLRIDIWGECKAALGIAQVVEFYSSTEGNIFLLNLFDIPGVVGHLPLFPDPIYWLSTQFIPFFPFRVARYDFEQDAVWRHPVTGLSTYCGVGETGEIVGEIIQGFDVFGLRRFDGYHSEAETRRNVARSVFKKNDAYFLSGDLVKFDAMGFVTFVDRVGDTFRWKGENVSTMEVMNAMNEMVGRTAAVREAVVYGVSAPRHEGRAGMAKLTLTPLGEARERAAAPAEGGTGANNALRMTLDDEKRFLQNELYGLFAGVKGGPAALPSYAVPVFIRIDEEATGKGGGTGGQSRQQQPHAAPESRGPCSPPGSSPGRDEASAAAMFKYRRHVLVGEGYSFALSVSEPAASRVYVLVRRRELLTAVGVEPVPPSLSCGYLPLNAKTVGAFGEELQKCGW